MSTPCHIVAAPRAGLQQGCSNGITMISMTVLLLELAQPISPFHLALSGTSQVVRSRPPVRCEAIRIGSGGNSGVTVLVTGATGLLGSHLTDLLLEEGRAVRVLVR